MFDAIDFKWDNEDNDKKVKERLHKDLRSAQKEDSIDIDVFTSDLKEILELVEKQKKQIKKDRELKKRLCKEVNGTYEELENTEKKLKNTTSNYECLIDNVSKIALELGLEEDSSIDEIISKIRKINHSDTDKEKSSMYYYNLYKKEKKITENIKKSLKGIIKKKDTEIYKMSKKINEAYFKKDNFKEWFEKEIIKFPEIHNTNYYINFVRSYYERIDKCYENKD